MTEKISHNQNLIMQQQPINSERIGYLICCEQTKDCFGNRHFIPMTMGYIEDDKIHSVIDEMFSLLLNSDDETVQREFPPLNHNPIYNQHLVLSASICQSTPPVGMFVSSKKWNSAVV